MPDSLATITKYQFTPVAPENAPKVWPQVEPLIDRVIQGGDLKHTQRSYHVLLDILSGINALWVVHDDKDIIAAIVTRIVNYHLCRRVYVSHIGGHDMVNWRAMVMEKLDDYARSIGAQALEGGERKGWAGCGFEITGVNLVRFVNG